MVLSEGVKCLFKAAQEGTENICIPKDPDPKPMLGNYGLD